MSHAIVNIMKPNDFFEEVELQFSDDIIENWFGGDISNTKFFKPKKIGLVRNLMSFNKADELNIVPLCVTYLISNSEEPAFQASEIPYYTPPFAIETNSEFSHLAFTDNTYIAIWAHDGTTIPENLEAWLFIDTSISYCHK